MTVSTEEAKSREYQCMKVKLAAHLPKLTEKTYIIIIIIYSANVKNNNIQVVQRIIRFNKTGKLNTR